MYFFGTNISVLIIIFVNPCCPALALPKDDNSESLSLKQFHLDKINTTNPTTTKIVKRNSVNELLGKNSQRSDENNLGFLSGNLEKRQANMEQLQFGQKDLPTNRHDASNLDNLLWQHFQRENNFRPELKPSPLNSLISNNRKTLLSQETAELDPIKIINKPTNIETKIIPSSDNVYIDLLKNQASITDSNINKIAFQPSANVKISTPQLISYLINFGNIMKKIIPYKDCTLVINLLPVLLINNFINSISTIRNSQLADNLIIIPFVISSIINFLTSFLFIDEYCKLT